MKFICGNCKEVIKQGNFQKHYASWMPHEKCGYETYFPEHLPGRDKGEPRPVKTRPIGEEKETKTADAPPVSQAEKDKVLREKNGPIVGHEQLQGWVDPKTHVAAKRQKGAK
jgi:hypothetical protein